MTTRSTKRLRLPADPSAEQVAIMTPPVLAFSHAVAYATSGWEARNAK